jgi:hypothetical protein
MQERPGPTVRSSREVIVAGRHAAGAISCESLENRMTTRPRIDGIDFWRGFALLSIFINHAPDNILGALTHRNFGFSDAAELFVFLSGVSVALAYGLRFLDGRVVESMRALGRRVFTLYWVQILISLLAVCFLIASANILDDDDLMDDDDRDTVLGSPLRGIAAILGLTHQLAFFNILPLYIVLLLATPALLAVARRDRRLMLLGSAAVYLSARVFGLNMPTWPVEGAWFFNPFAWQLIFAVGLYIGIGLREGGVAKDARLFAVSVVFVVASAFVVTNGFTFMPDLWDRAREALDISKTDLGLVRLVHFLALGYAVHYCGLTRLLARTPVFNPLCVIGRHSLPVFAIGSLLSTIDQVVIDTYAPAVLWTVTILTAGIVLQYLVAHVLALRALNARARVATARYLPPRVPQT